MSQPAAGKLAAASVGPALAEAAQTLAVRLVPDPARRGERLGEIFLACERVARERPERFDAARRAGDLDAFLAPHVNRMLSEDRAEIFRGGWLGTYVGADGRDVDPEPAKTTDREALHVSEQAFARAVSLAEEAENPTLLRNLRWFRQRLQHRTCEAIARAEGKVPATVRTGVARARKYLLKVVHDLRHAQPAPLTGEAPPEIQPLRELWFDQRVDELAAELERTRAELGHDAHWLNLAALVAADRDRHEEAEKLYREALVHADAPAVRGRVLNNLGNLMDERKRDAEARSCWLRARQLVTDAPAPLLNLVAHASSLRDYASAQHYLAELGELLTSGRLDDASRDYVSRRLEENPKLDWLRDTEAWRLGPARWIRAGRGTSLAKTVAVTAAALLVALLMLVPIEGHAFGADRTVVAQKPVRPHGGDSMGDDWRLRHSRASGGDSMGYGGGGKSKGKGR